MASERNYNIAVQALAKIADPIGYMQKEAELTGNRLDGHWAVQLASDANFLKQWAREALKEIGHV